MSIKGFHILPRFDVRKGEVFFDLSCSRYYHAAIVIRDVQVAGNECPVATVGLPVEPSGAVHHVTKDVVFGEGPNADRDLLNQVLAKALWLHGKYKSKLTWKTFPSKLQFVPDRNHPGEIGTVEGNCAGFVEFCYEEAQKTLDILDDENPAFPVLTRAEALQDLGHAEYRLRERGLIGDGPWPVIFPGYQIAAFSQETFPYMPKSTRERFSHLAPERR